MKKAITILLIAALMLSLAACGGNNAKSKEQAAFDNAQKAYDALCDAADETISIMNSVYGAWYFGIYKLSDYKTSKSAGKLSGFAKETGLSELTIKNAINEYYVNYFKILSGDTEEFKELDKETMDILVDSHIYGIEDFNGCLELVYLVFEAEGITNNLNENLTIAKDTLKIMTNDFDDYKHYPTLKDFYSKVSSYAEFAQSPSGSFQQLKDTINDYENSIRTYRTDLSFVFD